MFDETVVCVWMFGEEAVCVYVYLVKSACVGGWVTRLCVCERLVKCPFVEVDVQ